jgi:hypothetical protein
MGDSGYEVIVGGIMYMMTKNVKFLAGFAILSVFVTSACLLLDINFPVADFPLSVVLRRCNTTR